MSKEWKWMQRHEHYIQKIEFINVVNFITKSNQMQIKIIVYEVGVARSSIVSFDVGTWSIATWT